MSILVTMVDEVDTAKGLKQACILVRTHIEKGDEPDENGVLTQALFLKFCTLASRGLHGADARQLARLVLAAFYADPRST
jgi:hypothetical protein